MPPLKFLTVIDMPRPISLACCWITCEHSCLSISIVSKANLGDAINCCCKCMLGEGRGIQPNQVTKHISPNELNSLQSRSLRFTSELASPGNGPEERLKLVSVFFPPMLL